MSQEKELPQTYSGYVQTYKLGTEFLELFNRLQTGFAADLRDVQNLATESSLNPPYVTYNSAYFANGWYTSHSVHKSPTAVQAFWKMLENGNTYSVGIDNKVFLAAEGVLIPNCKVFLLVTLSTDVLTLSRADISVRLYKKMPSISRRIFQQGIGDRTIISYLLAGEIGEPVYNIT